MQFTDKLLQNLKSKGSRYDLREKSGKGFGVRITTQGEISFFFIYHHAGRKRRMTLGSYPALSLADARKLHRDALSTLENGKDPASLQQQAKIAEKKSETVEDLLNEYLEKWAKPRKRSWKEDERILTKEIKPIWGKRKAKDITRRDVILMLDKILERNAPIIANRTLAVTRRMFNFAVERDIIDTSPCYLVKAPSKENRRDRSLSENEIKIFWKKLDIAGMTEQVQLALKLQLATAQRKGEIVSAEWNEIDLNSGWWIIPATKAKNGLPHNVPLSNIAISILQRLKEISNNSKWIFPSFNPNQHITSTAIDHALRRNKTHFEDVDTFTPHDLRRTTASHMTALGISRLVVSKILNHAENSVTAIYDRHSYDKEKKHAMDVWDSKLNEIISTKQKENASNVVFIYEKTNLAV